MAIDWIEISGNVLLFTLVFGMSATVDISCLISQLKNVKAILTGIICQFIALPLLGFMVVNVFDMPFTTGITLLVVTASPGGSYSNWWCSLFNADLALSVTMTAVSTILSVFLLPINLILYTKFSYQADVLQNLDWHALFVALSIVIAAIATGLTTSALCKSTHIQKIANHIGNFSGLALIIFSATMTNTGSADTKIWSREPVFYISVLIPCLGGLVLASVSARLLRLKRPECVTCAIEACYQNVGIATSVALSMFDDKELNEAMGVPFFYGVVEAILVGCYCIIMWKCNWTKAPATAPLCHVIITSYEVLEQEEKELHAIEIDLSESEDSVESQSGGILTTYFSWIDPTNSLPTKKKEDDGKQQLSSSQRIPPQSAESNPTHPFWKLDAGCV